MFAFLRGVMTRRSRRNAHLRRAVEEELKGHIDMRVEALEREGVPPHEAHLRALQEFGDLEDAARYCATVDRQSELRRWRRRAWREIHTDALQALRLLRRAPGFTAATVLTLAVAAGSATAMYAVLDAYLIRPMPFPEAERLVWLGHNAASGQAPPMDGVDWIAVDSIFAAAASFDLDGFTIAGAPLAEQVTGAWISEGYLPTVGIMPALGRAFTADEYRQQAPLAILSHDLWVRRYGADPAIIGASIVAHSADRPEAPPLLTVVGVMPREFWPIHFRESHLLRPLARENTMAYLARLAPDVSLRDAEARLDATVRAMIDGDVDRSWHMTLTPALERHSARVRPMLFAGFGAAMFMLLAACASVAGALVSRTMARRDEFALRTALGGSRARIARQLLAEAGVLASLAGLLGLGIAWALLDGGGALIERRLGTTVPGGAAALRPTLWVMVRAVAASTFLGALLGLVPALGVLKLHRGSPAGVRGVRSGSARAGGTRVRRGLVAAQVTLATILLFGAGLMFRTLARMADTDVGFHAGGVLTMAIQLPYARYPDAQTQRDVMDRLVTQLNEVDGVRAAAAVSPPPFWPPWPAPVVAEGASHGEVSAPDAAVYTVSADYFDTMGIPLREGRSFRESDDHAGVPVAIVSETLARRLAADGDVLGRRVRVRIPSMTSFDSEEQQLPWRLVVGVVGDTRKGFSPERGAEQPDVYVPLAQAPRARQGIVVRVTGAERVLIDPVRQTFARVDPLLAVVNPQPLASVVAGAGAQRRGLAALLGVFGAFSLGLVALALYASLAWTVMQRKSELAVRIAVGASARSILRLVVIEGLATAGVGLGCGLVASLALGRVLRNQVYGIGTGDPATLIAISLALTLAALAASFGPALRATRTDPAHVLRE